MLQTREWAYTSRRRVMYTERQIFCYLTFEASYYRIIADLIPVKDDEVLKTELRIEMKNSNFPCEIHMQKMVVVKKKS